MRNTSPSTPRGLTAEFISDDTVDLQWQAPYDGQTPEPGLRYSIRVGTTPGGSEIMSPSPAGSANVGSNTGWSLTDLEPGQIYYWNVESIDPSGSSRESTEVSFVSLFEPNAAFSVAGVAEGDSAWGDFDNDGLLDVLVIGDTTAGPATRLFRNTGLGLTEVPVTIPGVTAGAATWGDFDRDGSLDILITGSTSSGPYTAIFRNTVSGFELHSQLTGLSASDATWVDYDNDGDLDVSIAGRTSAGDDAFMLYENRESAFIAQASEVPGFSEVSMDWEDIDSDGWVDLAIAGRSDGANPVLVYRNAEGALSSPRELGQFSGAAVSWGDPNQDGYSDLLVTGDYYAFFPYSVIYGDAVFGARQQTTLSFDFIDAATAWVDFDNDGDVDPLLNGLVRDASDALQATTTLFNNVFDEQRFVQQMTDLPGISLGTIQWVDFDGDGDLDAFAAGITTDSSRVAAMHENQLQVPNAIPSTPTSLDASPVSSHSVVLSWQPGSDIETAEAAQTYGLRVGVTSGGMEIVSPMSVGATRQLAEPVRDSQPSGFRVDGSGVGADLLLVRADG